MTITQEMLIQSIAEATRIDAALVKKIFKAAEAIIFDYLTTTTPSEAILIRIFTGLYLESTYIPGTSFSKGMFRDKTCSSKIKIKPSVSRYYRRKLNSCIKASNNIF